MSLGWLAALQITGRRRSARPVTQSSSGIERSPGFPSPHVRNGSTADVSLQRGERQLRAISRLMRCNNVGAVSRLRGAGIQLIEQRLSFLQIARVKPFRKPAVDRSEKLAGLLLLALIAPQACEAGRPRATQATGPAGAAPRPELPVTGSPWRGALPRGRCVCESDWGLTSITRSQRAARGRFGHPSLSPHPRSRRGSAPTAREDRWAHLPRAIAGPDRWRRAVRACGLLARERFRWP